ncbi:MAG: hypothetical protein AUK35_10490 [Zetaproteobacteria bacterium CG2_30_46_52]|nr:MAG: hypothetical protein AUK35_10490 [Zetaproteobacteria bacterium CG2_30_46_52]
MMTLKDVWMTLSGVIFFAVSFNVMPTTTLAASCCGGGSGAGLLLPKLKDNMVGITIDYEKYDGFWDNEGLWRADPAGSSLSQTRFNMGYAKRITPNWQASIGLPYVRNDNEYSQNTFKNKGLGDSTISLWYEAFDEITCTFLVETWEDLKPAMYFGATLNLPTGISPYDDVQNNFDITGRGFYRLDMQALFDKTVYPWNASIAFNYGTHLQRSINREYGAYVEPYTKKLGDRKSISISAGYTVFLKEQDTLTFTAAYSDMREDKSTIAGLEDSTSGMKRRGFAFTTVWASADKSDVYKLTFSHAPQYNDWGQNFPTTQILSMGVTHAYD